MAGQRLKAVVMGIQSPAALRHWAAWDSLSQQGAHGTASLPWSPAMLLLASLTFTLNSSPTATTISMTPHLASACGLCILTPSPPHPQQQHARCGSCAHAPPAPAIPGPLMLGQPLARPVSWILGTALLQAAWPPRCPHMWHGASALSLWACTALTESLPRVDWSLPAKLPLWRERHAHD